MARCKGCGADITWTRNLATGSWMPPDTRLSLKAIRIMADKAGIARTRMQCNRLTPAEKETGSSAGPGNTGGYGVDRRSRRSEALAAMAMARSGGRTGSRHAGPDCVGGCRVAAVYSVRAADTLKAEPGPRPDR
jgi:hypothetical protein